MSNYLTLRDLAERWGQTRETVTVWRHRGKLPEPDLRIGRAPVWKVETIEEHERENGNQG